MAYLDQHKRDFARLLRCEQTDAERFCCLNPKIVIELDGGQHKDRKDYDKMRTAFLRERGFKVIRFWDNQVLKESEAVVDRILSALTPTLSHPSDGRGS